MSGKFSILTTRKLSQSSHLTLEQAGFCHYQDDWIEINLKAVDTNNLSDTILITSQNAVKALLQQNILPASIKNKTIYCVGQQTKALLELHGCTVSLWADDARSLSEQIIKQHNTSKINKISFLCGNLRQNTLPNALTKAGIELDELIVHQTKIVAKKWQTSLDAIVFFSPSAVQSYLINNSISTEICFCIGNTTAKALQNVTSQIIIAKIPTIVATLQSCIDYYYSNQETQYVKK